MRELKLVDARDVTTMRCGGRIAVIYEPETKEQLQDLINRLDSFIVLGGGSNMIFPDSITGTAVIRLGKEFGGIGLEGNELWAGASASTAGLLKYCINNALTGLEFLAGIPGTVGGALFMNAGTADKGIMDAVHTVDYIDKAGLHTVSKTEVSCGYRAGGFLPGAVITGVRLDTDRSTAEEVRSQTDAYLKKRSGQPKGSSSGSVFRNPPGAAAGYLIDQAGMKGYRIGGAKVSEIHANFIINDAGASTEDVKSLIKAVKERVKERFGVELQEEVRIVD